MTGPGLSVGDGVLVHRPGYLYDGLVTRIMYVCPAGSAENPELGDLAQQLGQCLYEVETSTGGVVLPADCLRPIPAPQNSVLALDVATRTGWAVAPRAAIEAWPVDAGPLATVAMPEGVGYGTFDLSGFQRPERMRRWAHWLRAAIKAYGVTEIWAETPIVGRGQASTRLTVEMHGVIALVCAMCGLDAPQERAPSSVKKQVTGSGRAEKADIIAWCRRRGWSPQDDNTADALAVLDLAARNIRGVVAAPVKKPRKARKPKDAPLLPISKPRRARKAAQPEVGA